MRSDAMERRWLLRVVSGVFLTCRALIVEGDALGQPSSFKLLTPLPTNSHVDTTIELSRVARLLLASSPQQGFNGNGHSTMRLAKARIRHSIPRLTLTTKKTSAAGVRPAKKKIWQLDQPSSELDQAVRSEGKGYKDIEKFAVPSLLMLVLGLRTFALKTLSADPAVNLVLGLRLGEEALGAFVPQGSQMDESAGVQEKTAAVAELPTWFAWDLVEFAALLRVLVGIATVQALAVAPMPVFGVVCSLEPGIAFLILLALDYFREISSGAPSAGESSPQASQLLSPNFGAQEIALVMLVTGAAVTKLGDLQTEAYVYGLCLLKALLSAAEDVFQDEARIENKLGSAEFIPTLFKRVLPLNAAVVFLYEVLPTLLDPSKTLFPDSPSPVILLSALATPFVGYLAQLFWFETNRVSGDPVITMSLQPPKDALTSFFVPGSFTNLNEVSIFGYVLNLLGVGFYAANSERGQQRREELDAE